MNKLEAKNLVFNTFENTFDETRFTYFIKNLLNNLDESKSKTWAGNYIPESFRNAIKSYKRIGQYTDKNNNVIDILIVNIKREITLERARTLQRNFIARHLKQRNHEAALVAFYSEGFEDWRFSLVKMDFNLNKSKIEIELTPAKRYSFLVGANERSHTAQSQFQKILTAQPDSIGKIPNPSLSELEQVFNIETVTKEFFSEYRNLFIHTKEALDKVIENDLNIKKDFEAKGVNSVDFSKKLLGQIIFLYFLQKKGWFGVERDSDWGSGSKKFLRELLNKKHGEYKNFFNDILEPLFYEALRYDRQDYYYSRFNCKIPFLNGGLFDPINNYDWVHTDINIPNELFSNNNKTPQGDIGNGIFDIFDRYNFTVIEDEPLEKEVAIDPELLGKAYEKFNAIRPDNFNEYIKVLKSGKKGEENKFNKQYGVYYTPREIVQYMCRESLINYLASEFSDKTDAYQTVSSEQLDAFGNTTKKGQLLLEAEIKLNPFIPKEDFETLINSGELIRENELIAAERIKVKGNETETYYHKLPKNIIKNAKLIDEKLSDILICDPAVGSGAFPVGMLHEIINIRDLLTIFINESKRNKYNFKRECIEKSLYGVDIDSGAVEIAKLRLWLSLVVDENDITNIKPLPNLDYKIVCGDSLLNYPYIPIGLETIEKLKQEFIIETNPTKKIELKDLIDKTIYGLYENSEKNLGYKVTMDFNINFSEVFHKKNGFDIVIGNPPYVEHKKLKNISSLLKNNYLTYSGTADLYVYFYEIGIKILREKGTLIFITSNKFIKTSYGINLRKYFIKYKINEIIDFTEVHVFDALVASCIFSITKHYDINNKLKISFVNDLMMNFTKLSDFINKNNFELFQHNLTENIWQLVNETNRNLKQKIENGSVIMSETDTIKIYRGITTGYNPAFIIDDKKRKELLNEDKANHEIIKPLLQGRNIRKWVFNKSDEYLMFIPWHFPYNLDNSISGASTKAENAFKKNHPSLYNHLKNFKKELSDRNKDETGIRYEWYALQRCAASYSCEFEKEKIIWGLTSDKWTFAYDNENNYLPSNGYILTSSEIPIKYLLALLNSKLMEYYFDFIGIMTAGGAYTLKQETVSEFPIKIILDTKHFNTLVDKILNSKKLNPPNNTKHLEDKIDIMVYKLYNLTYEEVEIIDSQIGEIISKQDYDKFQIQ